MELQFLDFDESEDGDGGFSASALASPAPTHTPALIAEVRSVLNALHRALGEPGPLDEGHTWDLQLQIETSTGQTLWWQELPHPMPIDRLTLSLHLAGGGDLRQLLDTWTAP